MAWQDPFETFVGATGELYVAPVGTAFPSDDDAPSSTWQGVGYIGEDGVAVSYGRTIQDFRAWQRANPIRRSKTEETFQVGAALEQWNEVTVPLAFGGGAITSEGGGYKYTPAGAAEAIEERALLLDVFDGDRQMRVRVPRGNIAETVESTFARGALAVLPITFQALQPDSGDLFTFWFSDSGSFAVGS